MPSSVRAWGAAYHGLVTAGSLTLPNSQQISYPQPPNGDAHRIEFAGTPEINLTTSEKSALLQEGKVFYKYALLSGGHVYGEDIAADFIYQSPNGKRWAVDTSDLAFVSGSMANALSGDVVFTRFGDFVATDEPETLTPEVYTVAVSLADAQQSTPVITSLDLSETLTSGAVYFEAVKSDGSECILAVRGEFDTASPEDTYGEAVTGFVKLEISGDEGALAVAASVYKSRLDTLGVFVKTQTDNLSVDTFYFNSGTQEWESSGTEEQGKAEVTSGTQDFDHSITNRLLAIQYDANDALVELKITASYEESLSGTAASTSGSTISNSSTASSTVSFDLSFGANSTTLSGVGSASASTDYDASGGGSISTSWVLSATWRGTSESDTDSASPAISGGVEKMGMTTSPLSASGFNHHGLFTSLFVVDVLVYEPDFKKDAFGVARRTGQLYGFDGSRNMPTPPSSLNYFRLDALSPTTVARGLHTSASEGASPYAAYHPVTGDITWYQSSPVAYV